MTNAELQSLTKEQLVKECAKLQRKIERKEQIISLAHKELAELRFRLASATEIPF